MAFPAQAAPNPHSKRQGLVPLAHNPVSESNAAHDIPWNLAVHWTTGPQATSTNLPPRMLQASLPPPVRERPPLSSRKRIFGCERQRRPSSINIVLRGSVTLQMVDSASLKIMLAAWISSQSFTMIPGPFCSVSEQEDVNASMNSSLVV